MLATNIFICKTRNFKIRKAQEDLDSESKLFDTEKSSFEGLEAEDKARAEVGSAEETREAKKKLK